MRKLQISGMGETMKKYSGKNSTCEKCGETDINTYYCEGSERSFFNSKCRDYRNRIKEEHLHRRCKNCNFEWLEACFEESIVFNFLTHEFTYLRL